MLKCQVNKGKSIDKILFAILIHTALFFVIILSYAMSDKSVENCNFIPVKRINSIHISQLSSEYSTTPGGTAFSTTPGGI